MKLASPQPFVEALSSLQRRNLLPTNLGTAQLQQLEADIRLNSFYSARTLLEDVLDGYKQRVGDLLNPRRVERAAGEIVTEGINVAKAREEIKALLKAAGYRPDADLRGTIQDLSSDGRINLVLRTNTQMMQGEGWWLQGQDAAVLDEFPAQELFRAEARVKERDWIQRFRLAGQQTGDPMGTGWTITSDGKMIALKNHPIWQKLSDPSLFPDGLGNPWPPFAFSSGMDVRDVDRDTAESIGIIQPGQIVQPMTLAEVAA